MRPDETLSDILARIEANQTAIMASLARIEVVLSEQNIETELPPLLEEQMKPDRG